MDCVELNCTGNLFHVLEQGPLIIFRKKQAMA